MALKHTITLLITLLGVACRSGAPPSGAAITEITIERAASPCGDFGYAVRLLADGTVYYRGDENAPMSGQWKATLPTVDFLALAALIESYGYFELADTYGTSGTHFGPTTTSVLRGGYRKTVVNHGYYQPAGPLRLQWIEAAIDVILRNRTDDWQKQADDSPGTANSHPANANVHQNGKRYIAFTDES